RRASALSRFPARNAPPRRTGSRSRGRPSPPPPSGAEAAGTARPAAGRRRAGLSPDPSPSRSHRARLYRPGFPDLEAGTGDPDRRSPAHGAPSATGASSATTLSDSETQPPGGGSVSPIGRSSFPQRSPRQRRSPVSVHAPSKPAVRDVQVRGEKLARSSGFEWLARAGFVARGLIYGIIGILAIELALDAGGKTTNQQGALEEIARQPFGKVLLTLVAIGLAGYALWRLIRALLGHGPEDSDSAFDRLAALGSGIVYAGLCAIAVEILVGAGGNSGNTHKTTAGVLGWPAGTWLVV